MEVEKELLILSPFESPDIQLVLKAVYAGAFGVLHLGKNQESAKVLIESISKKTRKPFGICIADSLELDFIIPENVTKIIIPFKKNLEINTNAEILYQVYSLQEAEEAITQKVSSIVIKGNEGLGGEAKNLSFDIFRKIIYKSQKNNIKIYIQGDIGIHTSAAFLALGAHGIIFDSQIALFPECKVLIPESQDISIAEDILEQHTNLKKFVCAFFEAAYGHLHQAKNLNIINYEDVSIMANVENNDNTLLISNLILCEKQIIKMIRKEKNLSKFSLVFSHEVVDAFFTTFVSIMTASAGAKGIKIRIAIPENFYLCEKISLQNIQSDTKKLLAGLTDIPPVFPASNPLNIAIVGMECIYPGAANLDEYWRNILLAKDCITEIPASHWDKDKFYKSDASDTDYSSSKWGGFIPTIDFDPVEFGIMPQSMFKIEPSHLLSLLVVKRALKDAGYENLSEYDFENTSIFMGANSSGNSMISKAYFRCSAKQILGEIPEELNENFPTFNEYTFSGFLPNILTGRIANRLNFGGRNYTVDAACASSLASLDIACKELSSGHSDIVVFGGADLTNTIVSYLMFSSMRILSSKSYCSPFDASADGIIMGEGIGVLILKRLEDAERDGNKIYAVIKGIGGSSDGRNLSITAPGRKGEIRAMERAYQSAGILPSQVGIIEAHGTGTVVGDRMELSTLTDLFIESGALSKQTSLGSVKSQIGHTKCAAGVAGLIKSILSVYHGIIPPTIHIDKLNAYYEPKTSPFVFNKQAGLWNDKKRIAGISAFGFGGTNFHAIIDNYQDDNADITILNACPSELFVFRGNSLNEAKILMQKVQQLISLNDSLQMADIAFSLALYNDKEIQVSIVAGSIEELLTKINTVLEDRAGFKIFYRNVTEGKVVFLFPGEGSQYVNMARDLFVAFPLIRRLLIKHDKYIKILFPDTAFDEVTQETQEKNITNSNYAQPIIGMVDLAIAEYLRFLGIMPDMIAGYSYGEIPALCFSGVISPDDLVAISEVRAKVIYDNIGIFADDLRDFNLKSPEIPVWANLTAEKYPDEIETIKNYIAKNLVQPVNFTKQLENMYDDGARIFIETGPGKILLDIVESVLGKNVTTIQTENKSSESISFLLRALAQYLSLGKYFHIEKLFEGRKVSFLCIDEPEQYEKSPTGWLINGNEIYPSNKNNLKKASIYSQVNSPVF